MRQHLFLQVPSPVADSAPKTETRIQVNAPAPTSPPLAGANPVLIDSTLVTLILASLSTVVTKVGPSLFTVFQSNAAAELEAKSEVRKAEIAQDEKNQETLHSLIDSYAKASQLQSTTLIEAVVSRVTKSLDEITNTQTRLVEQVDQVAKTQASIAETQRRTLEILLQVEGKLDP